MGTEQVGPCDICFEVVKQVGAVQAKANLGGTAREEIEERTPAQCSLHGPGSHLKPCFRRDASRPLPAQQFASRNHADVFEMPGINPREHARDGVRGFVMGYLMQAIPNEPDETGISQLSVR
jgi:hypothetical protein